MAPTPKANQGKDLGLDPLDSTGSQGTCPGWAPWRTGVRSGHAGCHHTAWRKPQDSTNQAHMLKKAGPDLFCVTSWNTPVFFFWLKSRRAVTSNKFGSQEGEREVENYVGTFTPIMHHYLSRAAHTVFMPISGSHTKNPQIYKRSVVIERHVY